MFNGQSFMGGNGGQPFQQQDSNGAPNSNGSNNNNNVATNPQIQALLQQQQFQKLRWQQMQQQQGAMPNQQQPSTPQQQQFVNPAAFLNQSTGVGVNGAMFPGMGNAQAGPSSLPAQQGPFGGGAGNLNPQQLQQQFSASPANFMAGLGGVNPQQLQAMIANASGGGAGGGGSINPAAMFGGNSAGGSNAGPSSSGMIDPAMLMQQMGMQGGVGGQNQFGGGMAGMGGMGGMGGPSGAPPYLNGQSQGPQRPQTAASSHGGGSAGASIGTPEPAAKPARGKGSKKARASVVSDANSTPGMPNATIPAASPHAPDHSRQGSVASSRMPGTPAQGPFPGQGPSQQYPPTMQQQQMQMPPQTPGAGPSSWRPSLGIAQQQEVMARAWDFAKSNNMNPAEVLGRMRLLFVKGNQLPGGGQGVTMPNGAAVITFDEAQMLGILGAQQGAPSAPMMPTPLPQQAQTPQQQPLPPAQQQQQQQQQRQSMTNGPPLPAQSPATRGFGPTVQSPAAMSPQQPRARQPSSARPESRAGLPPGVGPGTPAMPMGPPSNYIAPRPSMAPEQGMNGMVGVPLQGVDAMRRPSMHETHSGLPPQAMTAAGLPTGMPAVPSLAAMPPAAPPAPPRPDPNLPPVHGGVLPPKTKSGHPVTRFNTRSTPLPNFKRPSLTTEDLRGDFWEPMSEKDEQKLLAIMATDSEYEALTQRHMDTMHQALRSRIEDLHPLKRRRSDGTLFQPENLHWWECADDEDQVPIGPEGQFRIIFPEDRRLELQEKRGGRVAATSAILERLKPKQLEAVGEKREDLVAIRLELDFEGWKLRDTFTWNASDDVTSYDEFARNLCEDYGLPEAGFIPLIREAMATQIAEHVQTQALRPEPARKSTKGKLDEEDAEWWKRWRETVLELEDAACGASPRRKRAALAAAADQAAAKPQSQANGVRKRNSAAAPATLRIPIKLDITVGAMNLVDQFEWDILDEDASAEAFAHTFAADLGLTGEFETAIAHSIREQTDVHIRCLALVGHTFDGSVVSDDEMRGAFLPEVSAVSRVGQDIEEHTPRLLQLSEFEVERIERERERENKRKKRQTRGRRGVNMPDREPLKTQRTPVICGLQAAQIEAAGGAAVVAAAAAAAAGGIGVDSGPGMRTSSRRAAAVAASAHLHAAALSEFDSPTPAAEVRPSQPPAAPMLAAVKRQRLENHGVHFRYPGGLGRSDAGGPRFAPGRVVEDVPTKAEAGTAAETKRGHTPLKDSISSIKATSSGANSPASMTNAPKGSRPEDFAHLQPVMVDGQWYCSNCGMPGWLTLHRRKGPLGEKTLCGVCGKFWHRFRRMKPVQYTRDEAHHRAANGAGAGALRGLSVDDDTLSSVPTTARATPARDNDFDTDAAAPRKLPSTRGPSPDLPFQPVGSPSDDSDSDHSQSPRVSRRTSPSKRTTIVLKKSASPSKPEVAAPPPPFPAAPAPLARTDSFGAASTPAGGAGVGGSGFAAGSASPHATPSAAAEPPPAWLTEAADGLRAKYRHDRFELRSKGPGLWRIKCLDCPGKLYTPGPSESLSNFEVHLKNRSHRASVTARIEKARGGAGGGDVGGSASAASPGA